MKTKTLFKALSGLAICSSLVPFSVAYSNTHTHTQDSLNVGNYTSNKNEGDVIANLTYEDDGNGNSIITGCTNATQATKVIIPAVNPNDSSKKVVGTKDFEDISNVPFRGGNEGNKIKSVEFEPDSEITYIGNNFFSKMTNEFDFSFPNHEIRFGEAVFAESTVKFNIPNWMKNITSETLSSNYCIISHLTIPSFVNNIGTLAFWSGSFGKTDIYLNWSEEQLKPIIQKIKNPNSVKDFIGIFCTLNPRVLGSKINRTNTTIHLPSNVSAELKKEYMDNFGPSTFDSEGNPISGVGLGSDTKWVLDGDPLPDPTPEEPSNIWAPLMGGIFGAIAFGGLTTGTVLVIKNKRNKSK